MAGPLCPQMPICLRSFPCFVGNKAWKTDRDALICDGPREPQYPKSLEKKKPESSSKVGFGGIQEIGQKAGPKVGFTVEE